MSQLPENERPSRAIQAVEQVGALQSLMNQGNLTLKLIGDRRVSWIPKVVLIGLAAAYVISPVDVLPALALGPLFPLGALDDIGVIALVLTIFNQTAPAAVVAEHLRAMGAPLPSRIADHPDVIDSTADEL